MVTPESIYPLLPTDPKPLPAMPMEFLPGTAPKGSVPGRAPRGEDSAEKPAAAIEPKPATPALAQVPILPGGNTPVEEAHPTAKTPGARQEKATSEAQPATTAAPDAGSGIGPQPGAQAAGPATAPGSAAPAPEAKPAAGGALKPLAEAPGQ